MRTVSDGDYYSVCIQKMFVICIINVLNTHLQVASYTAVSQFPIERVL